LVDDAGWASPGSTRAFSLHYSYFHDLALLAVASVCAACGGGGSGAVAARQSGRVFHSERSAQAAHPQGCPVIHLHQLRCAVAVALLYGCVDTRHVSVMTVLDHGNCGTGETGVRLIDYPQLAQLRGARLLAMSGDDATARPVQLIAIMPGPYPTTGYALRLANPEPELADPLLLHVDLSKPPQGAVLAQVVTHPCLVVGIDDAAVHRVRVDVDSTLLGEVDLSRRAPQSP
jgi:PrcB C-terminal